MDELRPLLAIFLLHLIRFPCTTGSASIMDRFAVNQDPCQNDDGSPRRCQVDFINAAFSRHVVASSTCGNPPSRHCVRGSRASRDTTPPGTISSSPAEDCFTCDASQPQSSHPPSYLTDLNSANNATCWVSGLDPGQVTLTASLGKKYEVTYVSLQFCAPPPSQSMVVYKSSDNGRTWTPMQYYSSQCRKVFGKYPRGAITKANEQEPLCSEIQTANSASSRVAFVTLDGRPSAQDFENSPALQDFVTATDIRIVLGRAQSDAPDAGQGRDAIPLYFSLSDLAIGGRCKCNGHAHRCVTGKEGNVQCDCKHNTAGTDCQLCKPFHYDRPWTRGTEANPIGCTGSLLLTSII